MASSKYTSSTLLLIASILSTGYAAKVLVIPRNVNSHYSFMGRIGAELAKEGHQVLTLVASNAKTTLVPFNNFEIRKYEVRNASPFVNSKEFFDFEFKIPLASSWLTWTQLQLEFFERITRAWEEDCEDLLLDDSLYNDIKSAGFDIVLMDVPMYHCTYVYPYKLGLPYITVSVPVMMLPYGVPTLPSQVPDVALPLTTTMTFSERLLNAFIVGVNIVMLENKDTYIKKFAPERQPIEGYKLLMNSSMWFYLHDEVITYPRPNMPYNVNIGDIMVRDPKSLNAEFTSLLNKSTDKVVLVSMGSYFDHAPDEWVTKLCETFKQIPYTVIWKSSQTPHCELPANVHIFKWIPQNDLLAHTKVALFVSHCGISSLVESISHGVPMLGLPVGLDQPHNAHAMQSNGYGIALDIFKATSDEMVNAINDIISNNAYKERVTKASVTLRDKPLTAGKRVSYWVNHVVTHGAGHLRADMSHLNMFQYLMFDLLLFIIFVLLVCVLICVLIVRLCIKLLRKCCCSRNTTKTKTD